MTETKRVQLNSFYVMYYEVIPVIIVVLNHKGNFLKHTGLALRSFILNLAVVERYKAFFLTKRNYSGLNNCKYNTL